MTNIYAIRRLTLAIITALLCSTASYAYDFAVDSIYYNVTSENILEVEVTSGDTDYSGDVVIPDTVTYDSITYSVTSIGEKAFYNCDGLTSVEIPNSVISIGEEAFHYCYDLTSVEIGNSVTSIGEYAFSNCNGLTSVEIPNSVISIGEYAFLACSGLTSIEISSGVTSIGDGAFYSCLALTSIDVDEENEYYCSSDGVLFDKDIDTLICYPAGKTDESYTVPETVTIIEDYAFSYCYDLTSVVIGNSVTSIGKRAFYGCNGLTSVEIPNSVISIGEYAFGSCNGLTNVEISNSVISIGECAFFACSGLTSIEISSGVTSIGDGAFYSCFDLTSIDVDEENEYYCSSDGVLFDKDIDTLICYPAGKTDESYTVPETVTIIEDYAFSYCYDLTSVVIGNSVTSIGEKAFYRCDGLTSVEIPNSVTSIGEEAFESCYGLTSVVIGNSVTSIGMMAFGSCYNLTDVYSLNDTPPYCYDAFNFDDWDLNDTTATITATLYVPTSAVEDYESADEWCEFANIVGIETSYTVGITVSDEEVTVGDNITLVATIEDFETDYLYTDTVYAWYVSVDDGEAELIDDTATDSIVYTPAAAGTHSFYCSVSINDVTVNSSEVVVEVTETETDDSATGISSIEATADGKYNVYSISGVRLMTTTDSSDVESLPEGLYIVNGKKVVIKR